MLVLSRKVGESIVVPGQQLVLTVLEMQGGKVRLGICAPPGVVVQRREVHEPAQAPLPGQGALASRDLSARLS